MNFLHCHQLLILLLVNSENIWTVFDGPGQRSAGTFPTGLPDGIFFLKIHWNALTGRISDELSGTNQFTPFSLVFNHYFPIGKACRKRFCRSLDQILTDQDRHRKNSTIIADEFRCIGSAFIKVA